MLELGSSRWAQLRDAYGPASTVPDLLRALPSAPAPAPPEAQPWFDLWSRLCHQGDVYEASYAALPHIVAASRGRAPAERVEFLILAGAIAEGSCRTRAPRVPDDLRRAFLSAIDDSVPLALEALECADDADTIHALLSSLAALKGQPELAAGIAALEPTAMCPKCGDEFRTAGYDGFS